MSTTTPNIDLTLLATGENNGTWGPVLNNNFTILDAIAGEVIESRGSFADVNLRFISIENEISNARGSTASLSDRLSTVIAPDGTIQMSAISRSTASVYGITRLSVAPSISGQPIAVGTNDTRMLSQPEKDGLTGGSQTSLHKHYLLDVEDVLVPVEQLNQLEGLSVNVTGANLSALTGAGETNLHSHPLAGTTIPGFVKQSVSNAGGVVVSTNDTRMLTQPQKNELTGGVTSITSLHSHQIDAILFQSGLAVLGAELNALSGISENVTATNLSLLTGNSDIDGAALHNHDGRYYTKAEVQGQNADLTALIDSQIEAHNTSSLAHQGEDLELGNTSSNRLDVIGAGQSTFVVAAHADDIDDTVIKMAVKNKSGASTFKVTAAGEIIADKITVRETVVQEVTTLSTSAVAADNLEVNGNTTIGNASGDDLIVNATSTINAPVSLTGSAGLNLDSGDVTLSSGDLVVTAGNIITGGTVDGVDVSVLNTEIVNAREGEASLLANLTDIRADIAAETSARGTAITTLNSSLTTTINGVSSSLGSHTANTGNPHSVTLAQAITEQITATPSTTITLAHLNTLTGGGNAAALHTHNDLAGSISTINGTLSTQATSISNISAEIVSGRAAFGSLDGRLSDIESDLSGHATNTSNPHSTTLAQVITAGAPANVTIANLTTLTGGGSADALHAHPQYATDGDLATTNSNVTILSSSVLSLENNKTDKYVDSFTAATSRAVAHNLNTTDFIVMAYNASDVPVAITGITITDANNITVTTGTNIVKVVVIG